MRNNSTRAHWMVYLKWELLSAWKHRARGERTTTEAVPYAYGSAQVRLSAARRGDVVWVVTSPRFDQYRLPPSLIARLNVQKVLDRTRLADSEVGTYVPGYFQKKWRFVVLADRAQSRYFPLNNAYAILKQLTFTGNKKIAPENCPHCQKFIANQEQFYAGLPAHLQTVRRLQSGTEQALLDFAQKVQQGALIFLSYCRNEASTKVRELVEVLHQNGLYCWLDNLMIPQGVQVQEHRLSDVLSDGLRQSTLFLALVTPRYHQNKWTQREWQAAQSELNHARRRRAFHCVELLLGGEPVGPPQNTIAAEDLDRQNLAERIKNYLPKTNGVP